MRRFGLMVLCLLFAASLLNAGPASGTGNASIVNVTFWVNTSTVPDTITPLANIQLRGDPAPLTWDNATGGKMTNVAGDYWTVTLQFETGAALRFKIFADSENDGNTGWEANVGTGSTNREWTVGSTDETLPLLFYNTVNGRDQFYTPFTSADSIDVLFRVNMAGNANFNPVNHIVGVRGGTAPLDWGVTIPLTAEKESENTGQVNYPAANFWSGVIPFPKAANTVPYKYVVANKSEPTGVVEWESQPDRMLILRADSPDTTLYWRWFSDIPPIISQGTDTVVVTFRTDVTQAIQDRGFAHGDTIEVGSGYFGSANTVQRKRLLRQSFTNIYAATDTVVTTIGEDLDYQYYLVKNGADVRENYFDFTFTGSPVNRAERRRVNVAGASLTVEDIDASIVSPHRRPTFPNQSVLARNVLVTWEVDLRPAICQVAAGDTLFDIQGDFNITEADSILKWGVWMNGPAVGNWSNPGGTDWGLDLQNNLAKKMYDDGTNGDRVAGDSIFTRQVLASPDSINVGNKGRVGQVYKFGIAGGDNESGRGGYGNNHLANIDDSAPTFTIYTQFGSINPAYYKNWDFDNRTCTPAVAVEESPSVPPAAYYLDQNYPNPFNPETEIRYGIPKNARVAIRIYNISGQLVTTLYDGQQVVGNHAVRWNGVNSKGERVSSGVYFYKLETADFVETRKLIFTK